MTALLRIKHKIAVIATFRIVVKMRSRVMQKQMAKPAMKIPSRMVKILEATSSLPICCMRPCITSSMASMPRWMQMNVMMTTFEKE